MNFNNTGDLMVFIIMMIVPFLVGKIFGTWKSSITTGVITGTFFIVFINSLNGIYLFLAITTLVLALLVNLIKKQGSDPEFKKKVQKDVAYLNKRRKEKETLKNIKKQNIETVECPNCHSTNIQHISNNKKGFSVGKALGGAALTGGVGTLAGFAGKKGKTDRWLCQDCGITFDK